ncbi:gliding motility protein GldN [Gangjinia marincola]
MMKFKFYSCFVMLTLIGIYNLAAQENMLNAKTVEELNTVPDDEENLVTEEPLEYGYVDERDILWGKSVWEVIDLDERVNLPLYYPIEEDGLGNRKSLYYTLIDAIKSGEIANVYADEYFSETRTLDELEASFIRRDTLAEGFAQINQGEQLDEQFVNVTTVDGADVKSYQIRGTWYFDKRQGELRYRLIGIAPVMIDAYSKSQGNDSEGFPLFWVFYPEARKVLHNSAVYNGKNTSQPISFDHLLNSRRFNAIIIREANIQGNRSVQDYIADNALMQLLESQRIKESIRNFELDLWNY